MITQLQLKNILKYYPDKGCFIWIECAKSEYSKKEAGSEGCIGYVYISIGGQKYLAHRLAWLYVYGEFPTEQIDHINHNRSDNRIENLRCTSNQENHKNQTLRKTNKSGFNGVHWDKRKLVWKAAVTVDGILISLGSHKHKSDAIKARKDANVKYGFHENHGKIK